MKGEDPSPRRKASKKGPPPAALSAVLAEAAPVIHPDPEIVDAPPVRRLEDIAEASLKVSALELANLVAACGWQEEDTGAAKALRLVRQCDEALHGLKGTGELLKSQREEHEEAEAEQRERLKSDAEEWPERLSCGALIAKVRTHPLPPFGRGPKLVEHFLKATWPARDGKTGFAHPDWQEKEKTGWPRAVAIEFAVAFEVWRRAKALQNIKVPRKKSV